MNPPPPSSERAASVRRRLLSHYDRARRDLPWRGETDPYRILVSEVMLQQTRVETVRQYYGPWLERFPDAVSLASADRDDVLKAWEGLGYYRRARNLHAAARVVRDTGAGTLPGTYAALRALPGVGEYTAGAVASIAFGERVPAVDGNVRRVLSRLFDVADPSPGWLRDVAASLVDPERPGDWNQAIMELGATLCRPRRPLCEQCPLADGCAARAVGTQEDRPRRRERRAAREATFALAVLRCSSAVMLVQRPTPGLLAGMWAFPEAELQEGLREGVTRDAVRGLASEFGVTVSGEPEPLPAVHHRFTHLAATYVPWFLRVDRVDSAANGSGPAVRWIDLASSSELAIPVAQRKVLASVRARRLEVPVVLGASAP